MRAWQTMAIFIVHDLCGIRTSNRNSFHWKQIIFIEKIPKKVAKKIKIWHLLLAWHYATDYFDWAQIKINGPNLRLNTLFGRTSLHTPMWHRLVVKFVKINACSVEALLKSIDQTSGDRHALCRHGLELFQKAHSVHSGPLIWIQLIKPNQPKVITLSKSIAMFCGTDNILQNVPHIQPVSPT